MLDATSLGSNVVRLAGRGIKLFLLTFLLVILGGILLAVLSVYTLGDSGGGYRFLAVVLVILEAGFLAFFLAGRRAFALTLAEGLATMKLGSSVVRLVFDRLPATDKPDGAALSPGLQTLKPGEAEHLLANASEVVRREAGQLGGIKEKIQSRLIDLVQKYSLLRVESKPGEPIDLQSIRRDLEENIDDRLADKMRGTARFYTLLVLIGFPVLVAVQTFALRMLTAP